MNKDKPLVSVCVQTYNQEHYIKQCLDGIVMQKTNFKFEVLLGEDQSSDNTRQICEDYAKAYPDIITLFLRDRKDVIRINGNATGRFNFTENLKACQGKYIAICEGDDYWTDPLKLQKQVDYLEAHPQINICFHRAHVLKDGNFSLHPIPEPYQTKAFQFIELINHYNFIATASVLLRKPKTFELPDWFYKVTFGDLGLYKIVAKDKSIQCLDEVMCVYRVHDKGIWSGLNELKAKKNYISFYRLIFPELNTNEKSIATSKIKMACYKMGRLKFPKHRLLQKIYYMYLRLNL